MFGTRAGEWVAGGIVGCSIALLVIAMTHRLETAATREDPPPAVGQRLPHRAPRLHPGPQPTANPDSSASPTPAPDRNEIRLPLRPVKKETGTLQVQQPPRDSPVDPNAIDGDGVTPFMRAAGKGDVALLGKYLEMGAQINQMDHLAHTALYYATMAKSGRTVEWLIAHGAAPDCNCCDGAHSPLLHALETGELSVIEPILRADRPIYWCNPARDALYEALRLGDKPCIRALLTWHRTPPTLEGSSQPLLGYAIAWGDYPLLSLLLECGANPNTPLHSPVDKTFSVCIADKGLREYLETEAGMTPLMLAAATGRLDCAQALLLYGAKRGAATTGRYRMTAMDFAARRSAPPAMLQVLLGKSPRPEDQRMHIEVSIAQQRAVFYKDGQVAMTMPVSTGRPGFPTPTGQFVVTDKDRMHRSTLYPAYMPYFLRMSCRDFGLHAGVLPGYPDSHGCIRLPWGSAERLFREVDVGTLVTISR